jgi:hypothetical protein
VKIPTFVFWVVISYGVKYDWCPILLRNWLQYWPLFSDCKLYGQLFCELKYRNCTQDAGIIDRFKQNYQIETLNSLQFWRTHNKFQEAEKSILQMFGRMSVIMWTFQLKESRISQSSDEQFHEEGTKSVERRKKVRRSSLIKYRIKPECTLAETKIGRLVDSNSPRGGTVVIKILRFFFCSFISFISAFSQI